MTESQAQSSDIPVAQSLSSNDRLVITAIFSKFSPPELFDYWTKPELICQWWPQQAEIAPLPGGIYRLSWPKMGWTLNGRVTACVPGELLAFTWHWDQEPQTPERHVCVTLVPQILGGTFLTIEHTAYTETATDQQERAGHLEGWLHFLSQLLALQP